MNFSKSKVSALYPACNHHIIEWSVCADPDREKRYRSILSKLIVFLKKCLPREMKFYQMA